MSTDETGPVAETETATHAIPPLTVMRVVDAARILSMSRQSLQRLCKRKGWPLWRSQIKGDYYLDWTTLFKQVNPKWLEKQAKRTRTYERLRMSKARLTAHYRKKVNTYLVEYCVEHGIPSPWIQEMQAAAAPVVLVVEALWQRRKQDGDKAMPLFDNVRFPVSRYEDCLQIFLENRKTFKFRPDLAAQAGNKAPD